ncbi:hypothetical protein PI125_g11504 [Phytophthora idaei]|nr:hypothetical protein PI125_g11504 [Phytophthora idaei]
MFVELARMATHERTLPERVTPRRLNPDKPCPWF